MKLQLTGLDHLVIRVRDMDRMEKFYCDVLGCTVDRRRPELGLLHLRAGDAFIDLADAEVLHQRRGGDQPPLDPAQRFYSNVEHFALNVANFDVAAVNEHLMSYGLPKAEAVTRYGATGERTSMYLHDPEGNMVELRAVAP